METQSPQPDTFQETEAAERERRRAEILAAQIEQTRPVFSFVLIGCFVAVFVAQMLAGMDESVYAAGLVKPFVREGQFWRLLTSATLHSWVLHLYFNSHALYNIGAAIEALTNRAHVAVCFLLAAVGGSLTSFYLMPDTTSIGASGGVLGLLGFLGVYGFRHKQHLPPGFLKNILLNLALIAAIGVVGYGLIDNAAHAGGFVTGTVYGLIFAPGARETGAPRNSGAWNVIGIAALLVTVAAAAFSIWLILTVKPF